MSWLLIVIFYACNSGCAIEKAEYAVATEALCHARGAAFELSKRVPPPDGRYQTHPRAFYWCVPNN